MDPFSGEQYLIARARELKNPDAARAMILTAKTLYRSDFRIQFEAYLFEKSAGNFDEAAKSLSYL